MDGLKYSHRGFFGPVAFEQGTRKAMSEQERLLFQQIRAAHEAPNLAEALKAITRIVCILTGGDRCAVFLDDFESGYTSLVASEGIADVDDGQTGRLPLGPWCRSKDATPRRWEDLRAELDLAPPEVRESSVWIPMLWAGKPLGRLAVVLPTSQAPDQLENLSTSAEFASGLISSHRAYGSLSSQVAALTDLYEVGQALASTLDLDRVLKKIVETVARLVGASSCSIMLLDGAEGILRIHMSVGVPDEIVEKARRKLGEGIAGKVAETGQPIFTRDVRLSKTVQGLGASRYKSPSLISVPLRARMKVIGVLNVNDRIDGLDFTPKDFNIISLFANQAAIAIDNARLHSQLWTLSVTDGLTQTFVHSHLMEQLQQRVRGNVEKDRLHAIIMVDLDHFKNINDTFGHLIGDDVLVSVAKLLRNTVRSGDIVARYGGEEFVVVLDNVSPVLAYQVTERLRNGIERLHFEKSPDCHVTASFGLAMSPQDGEDAESLIQVADRCLYQSKADGRNCTTVSENVLRMIGGPNGANQPQTRKLD